MSKVSLMVIFLSLVALDSCSVGAAPKDWVSHEGMMKLPEQPLVPVTTEIVFGDEKSQDVIEVYVSPSCLHCGEFLVNDVEKFLKDNEESKIKLVVNFLSVSAKDIFIMKLIQNETRDASGYYMILKNYIKRTIATINHIEPTNDQVVKFRGSNTDHEMIKFQIEASEFGFSDEKIMQAYPDMDGKFENALMKEYAKKIRKLSKVLNTKELNLPLIIRDGVVYKSLNNAMLRKS